MSSARRKTRKRARWSLARWRRFANALAQENHQLAPLEARLAEARRDNVGLAGQIRDLKQEVRRLADHPLRTFCHGSLNDPSIKVFGYSVAVNPREVMLFKGGLRDAIELYARTAGDALRVRMLEEFGYEARLPR